MAENGVEDIHISTGRGRPPGLGSRIKSLSIQVGLSQVAKSALYSCRTLLVLWYIYSQLTLGGFFSPDRLLKHPLGLANLAFIARLLLLYRFFWLSYENVISKKTSSVIGKESSKTNHIEQHNNTMRQSFTPSQLEQLYLFQKLKSMKCYLVFLFYYNASVQAEQANFLHTYHYWRIRYCQVKEIWYSSLRKMTH